MKASKACRSPPPPPFRVWPLGQLAGGQSVGEACILATSSTLGEDSNVGGQEERAGLGTWSVRGACGRAEEGVQGAEGPVWEEL